jgi:hypothetical protein
MKGWVSTYSNRPCPSPGGRLRSWVEEETVARARRKRRAAGRALRTRAPLDFDDESETPSRPLPLVGRLEDGGGQDDRR